jgi:hypothetical protein
MVGIDDTMGLAQIAKKMSKRTQNVNVTNDITNPVFVRDVDNPARQPFKDTLNFVFDNGESGSYAYSQLVVPVGKRLVIEYISANAFLLKGQKISTPLLISAVESDEKSRVHLAFHLPMQYQGLFSYQDYFVTSELVKVYVDQGLILKVDAIRDNNSGTGGGTVTIFGYLVDI